MSLPLAKFLPLANFGYKPLRTDCNEIRLIQLKPKSYQQSGCAPAVDVIHAKRGDCQPYTALSYAWGRNNDTAPLRIGDEQYYINERVDAALRQLQDEDKDVFVWVDQICINQQDNEEKGLQVAQMREIYSQAETVVAWLGPAENGSDKLLKHLSRMGTLIWSGDHQPVFSSHQTKNAVEALESAFRSLCERDYWQRLWIMQEYAVAKRLKIACGNVMIWDWQLQGVFAFLNKLSMNHQVNSSKAGNLNSIIQNMIRIYKASAASFMEGVTTRRSRYWGRKDRDADSLFQVVVTTLVLEQDYNFPLATDPRDRIFSVLQLAGDKDKYHSLPNYTWACERVYREVARTMLKQGHIDILAYCQFPRDSADIPSWAPDWRMKIRSPCTGPPWVNGFSASGQLSQESVLSPDDGAVVLQGILVGAVQRCEGIWDPDWSKPLDCAAAIKYLDNVRALCEQSPILSQKSRRDIGLAILSIASCRHVTDNSSSDISTDPHFEICDELRGRIAHDQTVEAAKHAGAETPGSTSKCDTWCRSYMEQLRFLHSRRPLLSDNGFAGTMPSSAQVGDVLCIFLGAKVPYVIRQTTDQLDAYSLVGEAYVYGMMDGECVGESYSTQSITLR